MAASLLRKIDNGVEIKKVIKEEFCLKNFNWDFSSIKEKSI